MNGRTSEFIQFGDFRFVPGDGLWHDGTVVPLPPRALAVLTALVAAPGTVVTKQTLMDAAWPGTFVTDSSLLEAIGLLRDALGDDRKAPRFIQTVHRRGYRFVAPVSSSSPLSAPTAPLAPLAPTAPPAPTAPRDIPFFAWPEWRPIVGACVTYAVTTVCVAIVFALFGQPRPAAPAQAEFVGGPQPIFAVSHTGGLLLQPPSGGTFRPSWNGDGLELAFAISKAGPFNLISAWPQFPTSWSADGRLLVFTERALRTGADVWMLDVATGARRLLVRTPGDDTWARFSPDGRSIAYMSNASGRWEVYVRQVSGGAAPVRVSTNGGAWPAWSADGRVYFSTDARADLRVVLDWFSEFAAQVGPS